MCVAVRIAVRAAVRRSILQLLLIALQLLQLLSHPLQLCICVLQCLLVYTVVHSSVLQRVATAPAALASTSTLAFARVRGLGGGKGSLSDIQDYGKTQC